MLFQVHDNAPIRHHSTLIRPGFPAVPQHRGTYNTATQRSAALGQWAVQDQTAAIDPEPRCSRSGANIRNVTVPGMSQI